MTQRRYKNSIERELQKLNDRIDSKIISGINYSDDARRHRMLRGLMKTTRKRSFFGRIFSLV